MNQVKVLRNKNDESDEKLKTKDDKICKLENHNKKILDEFKRLKEENKLERLRTCKNKESNIER